MVAPGPGSNQSLQQAYSRRARPAAITIPSGLVSSLCPVIRMLKSASGRLITTYPDKDSVRGRFILNRDGTIDTAGFPAVFFGIHPTNAYIATLSEYHTFTPTLINEFRFGYNRLNQQFPTMEINRFPGWISFRTSLWTK